MKKISKQIIFILLLSSFLYSEDNIKILKKINNSIDFLIDSLPQEKFFVFSGVTAVDFWSVCQQGTGVVDVEESHGLYSVKKRNINVLNINRFNEEKNVQNSNDWLKSHIIDLKGFDDAVLTFKVKRGSVFNTDVGFSENYFAGPEFRVIDQDSNEIRKPDELCVDFIFADSNNINKLINPSEEDWNVFPVKDSLPITGNPALTIFGGGGMRRGFDELNIDSALTYEQGLRMDLYDVGYDKYFKTYFIHLPDTIKKAGYFRFRIRSNSRNEALNANLTYDDNDDFYLRDIKIINLESSDSKIFINGIFTKDLYKTINMINSKEIFDLILDFNDISYQKQTQLKGILYNFLTKSNNDSLFQKYYGYHLDFLENNTRIYSHIIFNPFIKIQKNDRKKNNVEIILLCNGVDTLYYNFEIYNDDLIAYDHPTAYYNSIPYFSKINGLGMSLRGFSDGNGSIESMSGTMGGDRSGQFAIKFEIKDNAVVSGLNIFYSFYATAPDDIRIAIYKDSLTKENCIDSSITIRQRIYDDIKKEYVVNDYVTHFFKNQINLKKGIYYAVVSQLGETGIQIGGSGFRTAMITTRVDNKNNGKNNISLFIDDKLKILNEQNELVNQDLFYYQNSIDYGEWIPFAPTVGNPGYSYLNYDGISFGKDSIKTYFRGTFFPMMRVLLKNPLVTSIEIDTNNESYYYPNPTEDILFFKETNSNKTEIFTLLGIKIAEFNQNEDINIKALEPGIYLIKNGTKIEKIIKK